MKLLSYSPQAHFQDPFWSSPNKSELFISACQPRICSDCSSHCLTLPIDSSTYFLIGFLTASQILWLIALPPALRSTVRCVCADKKAVLTVFWVLKVTFTHSGGQSIFQHAAHRSIKYWLWCSAENWKQTLWFIMLLDLPSGVIFMIHFLLHVPAATVWVCHYTSWRSKGGCCHLLGKRLNDRATLNSSC